MFDNIADKIKGWALAIMIIGCISSILGACVAFEINAIWVGFIVLICGILVSWILSIFTYGFGELIEQTTKTANYTKKTYELQNYKHIMPKETRKIEKEVAEFEKERY